MATKSYGDKPQSVNKKAGQAKLRNLYSKMAKETAAKSKVKKKPAKKK